MAGESSQGDPGNGAQGAGAAPALVPERPYLRPWYRFAEQDGRLLFEYAHSAVVLEGKAAEKLLPVLLPLLDGTRTLAEISAHLGEKAKPAVENALKMLAEHELLTEGPPPPADTPEPLAQAAQFLAATSHGDTSVTEGQRMLEDAKASVLGEGALAQEVARLLRLSGITRLTLAGWPESNAELDAVEFAVVAPGPGELPKIEQWNLLALEARLPWLQVLPFDGRIAAVGPLYVPDDTCCFECYRRRRAANLDYGSDNFFALDGSPATHPTAPPLGQMIAGLAATLALGWLGSDERSVVPATMHALKWTGSISLSLHHVYRVPRCPACSEVRDSGTPAPWHE